MGQESRVNRYRRARFELFMRLIDKNKPVSILDVGGTLPYWKQLGDLYKSDRIKITVVNIDQEEAEDENISVRNGNACDLAEYPDNSFDVVHSNSVIEHVGQMVQMQQMAAEIRRLAPSYFVQTPNAGFPIEPHYKLPLVHWLPEHARVGVLRKLGRVPDDPLRATWVVQRTFLLTKAQMRALFPDAELINEKWFGLTKSIIAMRNGSKAAIAA
jgi:ubiquinone/menaquinone biosynthesis C-methylase UbiE